MIVEGQVVEALSLADAVLEQLQELQGSAGPTFGSSPSPTKRALFDAYAHFFRWSVYVQQAEDEPTLQTLRGKSGFQACQKLLRRYFETEKDNLRVSWLKPMHGFLWMMGEKGESEYRQWLVHASKCDENPEEQDYPLLHIAASKPSPKKVKTESSPIKSSPVTKGNMHAKILEAVMLQDVPLSPGKASSSRQAPLDGTDRSNLTPTSVKRRKLGDALGDLLQAPLPLGDVA